MEFSIVAMGTCMLTGAGIGAFHFGGLLWTVKRVTGGVDHPVALLSVSAVIRFVVTLAAAFFITGGRWQPVSAFLFGFLLVRLLYSRRTELYKNGDIKKA
jgi:F1F0 ATPase subunit 2